MVIPVTKSSNYTLYLSVVTSGQEPLLMLLAVTLYTGGDMASCCVHNFVALVFSSFISSTGVTL